MCRWSKMQSQYSTIPNNRGIRQLLLPLLFLKMIWSLFSEKSFVTGEIKIEKRREGKKQRKKTCILCSNFPMCNTQGQDKNSNSLLGEQSFKHLGYLLCFPNIQQGAGLEVKEPRSEPMTLWAANVPGGSLNYYEAMLAPIEHLIFKETESPK